MLLLKLAAFILLINGLLLILKSAAEPNWKETDPENVALTSKFNRGLWTSCEGFLKENSTWSYDCYNFDSDSNSQKLTPIVVISRQIADASVILGNISVVLMGIAYAVGILFVQLLPHERAQIYVKYFAECTVVFAGFCAAPAGVIYVMACSHYSMVVDELISIETQGNEIYANYPLYHPFVLRFVTGKSIYLGWMGGSFLVLAALIVFGISIPAIMDLQEEINP